MITIQVSKNFKGIDFNQTRIEKLIKVICTRFGLTSAIISVSIVDDVQMKQLNKRFLNRNCVTDCLSFDLSDANETDSCKQYDLAVNGQAAISHAASRGHSAEAELALYITHSLLHNFGFDDSTPEQAKKMHDTEDEILQCFGYGLVYNTNKGP
jgi:probable rRNA maturation factor